MNLNAYEESLLVGTYLLLHCCVVVTVVFVAVVLLVVAVVAVSFLARCNSQSS